MPIGSYLQAWRMSRGQSIASLAAKTGLEARSLEEIETGQVDPCVSMIETVASALGVPPSWLHGDPKQIDLLTSDADGDESDAPSVQSLDPVVERILQAAQQDRELYVLLTRVLYSGDPKLIRCLLYTSDAADERSSVDLGGRR